MTTVIAPTQGAGALFTQGGTGLTPGYSALDDRRGRQLSMGQEGVVNASDFMVVQRSTGANLSVDIGMPSGGMAYVQGDSVRHSPSTVSHVLGWGSGARGGDTRCGLC